MILSSTSLAIADFAAQIPRETYRTWTFAMELTDTIS